MDEKEDEEDDESPAMAERSGGRTSQRVYEKKLEDNCQRPRNRGARGEETRLSHQLEQAPTPASPGLENGQESSASDTHQDVKEAGPSPGALDIVLWCAGHDGWARRGQRPNDPRSPG